jgi:WD40 repeat protein
LPPLDPAVAAKTSFRRDVWPILKRDCWGCHSGANPKGGLNLDSFAKLAVGGESGPLFEAGKPDESLLVTMVVGAQPEMPKNKPPLSQAKVQVLRHWVLGGAKDDSAAVDEPVVVIPQAYQFAPRVTSVALSPDARRLAAAYRSEVVLVDVESAAPPRRLPTESDLVTHVEFSPDGARLAAVGGSPARYGEVRFFNPADGQVISARRSGHDTLFRGSFTPDGQAIAVGGADGAVHVVPVDAAAPERKLDLHSDWVLDAALTPDGKYLISGGRDKSTKITLFASGAMLRSADSSADIIHAVAADGQFAVSAGRARTLIGYELLAALSGLAVPGLEGNETKPMLVTSQFARPFEGQAGEVFDLATSGDRKLLAVASSAPQVVVYRIADRSRVAAIANLPAPVYGVALNADGTRLATGSDNGELRVFEIPSGKQLQALVGIPVVAK